MMKIRQKYILTRQTVAVKNQGIFLLKCHGKLKSTHIPQKIFSIWVSQWWQSNLLHVIMSLWPGLHDFLHDLWLQLWHFSRLSLTNVQKNEVHGCRCWTSRFTPCPVTFYSKGGVKGRVTCSKNAWEPLFNQYLPRRTRCWMNRDTVRAPYRISIIVNQPHNGRGRHQVQELAKLVWVNRNRPDIWIEIQHLMNAILC